MMMSVDTESPVATSLPAVLPSLSSSSSACPVQRDAFYLSGDGQSLFAWLHTPRDQETTHHGVVICPPIGFEQLHAHRGLRHLADQLAASQISTLRFDWHGTGDSSGDDADSDRLATWKENVRQAVRWMKEHLGCQLVSVVGLRMGATLAALALDDDQIENLVLWAPITNGRGYVRELNVIEMMSEARPSGTESSGTIEAAGFRLTSETASDLSKSSLLQSRPVCRRILIAGRDDLPSDQRVAEHFAGLGICVELQTWPGMAQMLAEPHKSQLAESAITEITSWLRRQVLADEPVGRSCHHNSGHVRSGVSHEMELSAGTVGVRETSWRISPSPDLFGILSEPASGVVRDLPVIVLLNGGSAYRIGPGRMNVEMARHFSSRGFRCLRLDLCGLGDSVPARVADENDSYAATAFRDIGVVFQALRARFGDCRFVLMGLCSGAYASFQSAAQFDDPDLIEAVLINPLTYFWRDGMSLETAPTLELIREHYYLNSALQPGKWLKLLSGRSHIGIGGVLRLISRRLGLTGRRPAGAVHISRVNVGPSHPTTENLTADLKRVMASERQLSLFFSTTDPGYRILTCQAGRQTRRMQRRGQITVEFIDNADHTFSRQSARQELIATLSRHLGQRYPVGN